MKKVLFASTALVAFAGAASAEVLITGSAEMGIFNADGSGDQVNGGDTEFFSAVEVRFTMTGETDGGLAFGATVDLDEAGNTGDVADDNGVTIFISGAFGTLTLGDTDGAMDYAVQDMSFNAAAINDDATAHAGYLGANPFDGLYDGQILRYDYTMGAFGFAVSAQMDDGYNAAGGNIDAVSTNGDPVLGLGFTYNLDLGGNAIRFGLGYEETEVGTTSRNAAGADLSGAAGDWDAIGVSVSGTFGDINAGLSYIDVDAPTPALSYDHTGVGIGYSTGAISLHANYGVFDFDDGAESDGFGLTAGYDLGGGASILVGYGDGTDSTAAGVDTDSDSFSLGVSMSF